MFQKFFLRQSIIALFFSLLLVACSASTSNPAVSNDLVIYSGRSESLVQPLVDQFIAETGINVQVRYGSTSEMAGVLLEEGANSPADLFFAQDPGGVGAIEKAGLFTQLPENMLKKVPANFASPNKQWVGISGRARVVVYNTDILSPEDLPEDIYGFIDSKWDGKIGWAPTNGSFQAMVTGMRAVWGEEKTISWLKGIQANHPIIYPKNTPIVAATAAGEIEVGFVNHYYLYQFLTQEGESFAARNYFLPSQGPGSLIMVSGAGILKTAKNEENALQFINYMLSEDGQQYFANETFEYPVIDGITIHPILPPLAELNKFAADISVVQLADLEGTQNLLLELGIID